MRFPVALAIATALTAAAPTAATETAAAERELASAIGNRQPEKPVDCISPQNQTSVQVIAGAAIVYGYGTRLYVNRPVDGAEALRQDDVLVSEIYRQRLCRLDTVTLFDPASRVPRGVVTLGSFVPYGRPR